ncbi:pseudaminic acid cytidylyltransferase [Endozoicomonas numazuensis]|uniref:NeuA n=1 Tax=Endozoicomonas numazuensis TaxID=1137799 RepID=A0A081NJK3_9GAMM|nr:pseudaminic acid cytidylyltransferase [Endozoicomonas numazuensis]KEQ18626.1 NeuA [Endozoicomonas numazuensis]
MNLAIIPARQGSKRIPEKNIRLFKGRPIIAYSIEAALNCPFIDKVIVSTNDQKAADIAKSQGAEVPFIRPEEYSHDHATTWDVINHSLEWYKKEGSELTNICCIYATAPFIQQASLEEGFQAICKTRYDYAFPVVRFQSPIQRALKREADGSVSMLHPEHADTRTQDLEPSYHDAGQFYWGKARAFKENKQFFGSNTYSIVLPEEQAQDIDTESDWKKAERLHTFLEQQK